MRPILLAALLTTACAHAPPAPPVNVTLPRASDGRPYSLSERRGEATIVYFFTTWCIPCQALEREIAEAAIRGEREGIEVVGVALDIEGRKLVAPYVAATDPPYPVLIGGGDVAAGKSDFGRIPELPAVLILDGGGHVRAAITGLVTSDALLERARAVARE